MDTSESYTDVLIIGAGLVSLIAALWMAKCGINARIIEKRDSSPRLGGADGLNPRSMEILDSFGLADDIKRLWEPTIDWCLWFRRADGNLQRRDRVAYESIHRTSYRFGFGLLGQGMIENIVIRKIEQDSAIRVEYEKKPVSIVLDHDKEHKTDTYPCLVRISCADGEKPEYHDEFVRAKYVIGADGARSWTRKQLGIGLQGTRTGDIWGVMDVIVVSDFPDIRASASVHSGAEGGFSFIRRERNLTRFYVQLIRGSNNNTRKQQTYDNIVEKLKRLIRPYTIQIVSCEWWSTYIIAQHLSEEMSRNDRVFLVGDAVHSHSPKIGLGMNVSMQDAYNLGWKIAGIINNQLDTGLLATYEQERRPVSEELLATDKFFLKLFDTHEDDQAAWMLQKEVQLIPFVMGFATQYRRSQLTSLNDQQRRLDSNIADAVTIGKRLPDFVVSNHATARIYPIRTLLRSYGNFHILVFAGDISNQEELANVNSLGHSLRKMNYVSSAASSPARLNTMLIHSSPRTSIELAALDGAFYPSHELLGKDINRVCCDICPTFADLGVHHNCNILIVRPDQYVGWCGGYSDVDGLGGYLGSIFA
ncbi:FAD binding domain-containing protein [Calycina marina]|uniref:FAD binding domain-containing protein n=1 Tax=Calycina marina TaxID=1763456 RepID=A0A9P8CBE7_9HELO|nr:FAD binding domain-containing protein [Calycina marina]